MQIFNSVFSFYNQITLSLVHTIHTLTVSSRSAHGQLTVRENILCQCLIS